VLFYIDIAQACRKLLYKQHQQTKDKNQIQ